MPHAASLLRWTRRSATTSAILAACLALALPSSAWAAGVVTVTVDPSQVVKTIASGAVGWGAMWKREMLWPAPGPLTSDAEHALYIEHLAETLKPLVEAADLRQVSWPWGVSFSTWGVNWENSARPWSARPADCARIVLLNLGSGWCERTVVGVGDLLKLADAWGLEALTLAVPLAVLDGTRVRWGPNFITHVIDAPTRERIAGHARALVDFLATQPGWDRLQRVYLEAGCEWRHYGQPAAAASYAALIRRLREVIPEEKVVIVASASDSADLEPAKAALWNRPLYEQLVDLAGVAFDLHRYRGMVDLDAAPDGSTAATAANTDRLVRTGVSQRGFFGVEPAQWGGEGPPMPSILLENAIHGLVGDHATHSSEPWPWPAVLAHADLVREALASPALAFLGWTWFAEDLPREWPHGALLPDGRLAIHAQAQAFLSAHHHGVLLRASSSDETAVRANVTRGRDGRLRLYGGNFGRDLCEVRLAGVPAGPALVETFGEGGLRQLWTWDGSAPLRLPALTLFRVLF